MMKNGGAMKGYADGGVTKYYDDGSSTVTYDDGSTITYDSDGEVYGSTDANGESVEVSTGSKWPTGYVSNDDGTATMVDDDGSTITVDEDMNVVHSTNATNSAATSTTDTTDKKTSTETAAQPSWLEDLTSSVGKNLGLSPENIAKFTGALPAAGAGALIASLLGSNFGSPDNLNKGLDMSKVGVINPRTTNFGIGPTRFVGHDDYGTSGDEYTPNAELLKNLNAPGYNPVNEGDYGYEDAPVEEAVAAPKMASGGLSSMGTPVSSYYTFGQPADILANLGMRAQPPMNPPEMMNQIGQQQPPQQAQQQGLPQQTPPQMAQQTPPGMPQQGMMPQQQGMPPPMRKGGLPHVSNVPVVEGRMDFRQGSAVHGEGDGQSDDIPAMLADGEYVIDAETVAQIGNGSTKAGAQALDRFREGIRAHKRSAPTNKIPPKTKALTSYLKGAK